jgi:hypothetical protein
MRLYTRKTLLERLRLKTNYHVTGPMPLPTPCWEWTAEITSGGYGMIREGTKKYYAHRAAYTLQVAPIPTGMIILHECDNRSCVRPDHLRIGTHADNMKDKRLKGRGIYVRGEHHPHVKLTTEQVLDIRKVRSSVRISNTKLAKYFNVSPSTVANIVHRRVWKHV